LPAVAAVWCATRIRIPKERKKGTGSLKSGQTVSLCPRRAQRTRFGGVGHRLRDLLGRRRSAVAAVPPVSAAARVAGAQDPVGAWGAGPPRPLGAPPAPLPHVPHCRNRFPPWLLPYEELPLPQLDALVTAAGGTGASGGAVGGLGLVGPGVGGVRRGVPPGGGGRDGVWAALVRVP